MPSLELPTDTRVTVETPEPHVLGLDLDHPPSENTPETFTNGVRKAPRQKPGRSKQDYETPRDFLAAVSKRFGRLDVDLAASCDNHKAPKYITQQEDSLSVPWAQQWPYSTMWLNPPFGNIEPWAAKCRAEGARLLETAPKLEPHLTMEAWEQGCTPTVKRPGKIIMLVPASVGSNWFAEHVHGHALVLGIRPRIEFVGADDPYPKDLMLCLFGYTRLPHFDCWRWK